jgi:hypothetical protein
MGKHRIEGRATARVGRDAVWPVLADITRWAEWGAWEVTQREREGDPPPDGVGAKRMLRRGRIVSHEEVTAFEPPTRLGYRLVSGGLPVRGYTATVTLSDVGEGTEILWQAEFDGKFPLVGGLMRIGLGRFMQDAAERVAREAERRAGEGARSGSGGSAA